MRQFRPASRRLRSLGGALVAAFLLLLGAQRAPAEAVFRSITVAWDASAGPGVIGYRLHYGTRSGDYLQVLDVGDRTSAEVPNLIEGTTYFFLVTAYDAAGEESAPSGEFTHTPGEAMLLNISTRALVGDGDDVLIAGFIIGGSSQKTVILRALGPSLSARGLRNVLANPALEVHGAGGLIAENDNWQDGWGGATLASVGFAPEQDAEPGIVVTLPPGAYTAVVRGSGGGWGTALLEVYDGGVPVPQ